MEAIYIEGEIIAILPETKGVSAKGEWISQDFVLKTEENYPKTFVSLFLEQARLKKRTLELEMLLVLE